jgi:hypothetical protein
MALDVFAVVIALLLVVLGIRGSYAQIWNTAFPNTPITTPGGAAVVPGGNGAGGQFSNIIQGTGNASTNQGKVLL